MNEHIHDQQDDRRDGDVAPEVIYIERDRGMFAAVRRAREAARAKGREWVADAVDAPLPQSLQTRVPSAWQTPRGRVAVGLGAVLILILWTLIFLWMMG